MTDPSEHPPDQGRPPTKRSSQAAFDERRARALVTQRLFGRKAASTARLERYLVSERLGSGANGVVYKAWDPVLRREVALKLLRRSVEAAQPGLSSEGLVEESRRCARLQHQNVGAIYSVGRAAEVEAWFVVMELLPGPTLREWSPGRTEHELREAFEAAARGLEAAHQHGVVHGDFKPDNAMFGADGVLRVVDFGGHGTPRYSAPEVRAGARPTTRADVYAFAVTLDELWGERPKPARLARMLARARAEAPEDRPPSATAIANAMAPWRGRTWSRALALAVPLTVLGVGAAMDEPCELAVLPTREDLPAEAETFAEAWNAARAAHCEAPAEATLRCLEQTRLGWERVAALASEVDDDAQTARVLAQLPTPQACLDDAAPRERPSPLRSTFRALELDIHVTQDLGLWHERGAALQERLAEVRAQASRLRDDAVEADAALYEGIENLAGGEIDAARSDFEAAYLLGTRARDADTAFYAAANLARLTREVTRESAEADRWLEAAAHASGEREHSDARGDMLALQGRAHMTSGEAAKAVQTFEAAKAAYGEDTPIASWVELYCGLGKSRRVLGEVESALGEFETGLARLSSSQPNTRDNRHQMCLLNGQGTTARILGRLEVSRRALDRLYALMLLENPESPDVFAVLGNLAQLDADAGDHEQALQRFRAVLEGFSAFVGPDSPELAQTRYAIAEQLFALGRHEEARVEAEAALRWNAPEPAASGAKLLLARIEFAAGKEASARAGVQALLEDEGVPAEVKAQAEGLEW